MWVPRVRRKPAPREAPASARISSAQGPAAFTDAARFQGALFA